MPTDTYLGMLTYRDALKVTQTCRIMWQVFHKGKGLRKVVRYGNLNVNMRAQYWRKISDQPNIVR